MLNICSFVVRIQFPRSGFFFFFFFPQRQYFECIIFIGFTRCSMLHNCRIFSSLSWHTFCLWLRTISDFNVMRCDTPLMSIVKQINSHLNNMNVITVSMQCLLFLFLLYFFFFAIWVDIVLTKLAKLALMHRLSYLENVENLNVRSFVCLLVGLMSVSWVVFSINESIGISLESVESWALFFTITKFNYFEWGSTVSFTNIFSAFCFVLFCRIWLSSEIEWYVFSSNRKFFTNDNENYLDDGAHIKSNTFRKNEETKTSTQSKYVVLEHVIRCKNAIRYISHYNNNKTDIPYAHMVHLDPTNGFIHRTSNITTHIIISNWEVGWKKSLCFFNDSATTYQTL